MNSMPVQISGEALQSDGMSSEIANNYTKLQDDDIYVPARPSHNALFYTVALLDVASITVGLWYFYFR